MTIHIPLDELALARAGFVTALDVKFANAVPALAGHFAGPDSQMQFHLMFAGHAAIEKESDPLPGGKTVVRLCRDWVTHALVPIGRIPGFPRLSDHLSMAE